MRPGSRYNAARRALRALMSRWRTAELPRLVRARLLQAAQGRGWLTPALGFRALCDEALLSACLVSAIAAVVAPIMILAGLKFGFIEIMRGKFIQDPSFRLITPRDAQSRPVSFFTKLSDRTDMAFVQPQVNLSNTSAPIQGRNEHRESFDIIATSSGDPLILENEGRVPGAGQVTLTAAGAAALDAAVGSEVKLVIYRSLAGRREMQYVPLKILSVLNAAADPERRAYVGLDLVQDIENYRAGIPVARRGWTGQMTPPLQVFDAAYVLLDNPIDEVEIHTLRVRYGFAESAVVAAAEFAAQTGLDPERAAQVVSFAGGARPVRGEQLRDLASQLGDGKIRLLPVVTSLDVQVEGEKGPLRVQTADLSQFRLAGATQADQVTWQRWRSNASYAQVERVLVPARLGQRFRVGDRIALAVRPRSPDDATQELTVTAVIDGFVAGEAVVMSPGLAGMLLQSRLVPLVHDAVLDTLLPADVGLRGFRAYARTIDDVPVIATDLRRQGVDVRTKADAIEQLQRLDRALTRITLIVAAVALLGGSAVLVASFYAAVERKKSDLSLLRLLGFSRGNVFSMPIVQSAILGTLGFILALALFLAFAALINSQYASDLTMNGSICRLELRHILSFAFASLGIAGLSSLLAANRTLQIDPAEALRQE